MFVFMYYSISYMFAVYLFVVVCFYVFGLLFLDISIESDTDIVTTTTK